MTDDLVPGPLRAAVAKLPPTQLRAPSPLPPLAVTWYTTGGCWSLAIALHEETGFPIELYYFGGQAKHAYVVDGDYALDARGRDLLCRVSGGADRLERIATEEELVARLAPSTPGIGEFLENAKVREAAARAARVILDG